MKQTFTLLAMLLSVAATAQNLTVKYTFSSYSGNTVFDESGNGNDGTMYGGAHIVSIVNSGGVLLAGKTAADYMSIPAAALNGLQDFSVKMKVRVVKVHTAATADNTIFSASNSSCFNCFGLAYKGSDDTWEVSISGVTYSIAGDGIATYGEVLLERQGSTVSLYYHGNLLGTVTDNTPLSITSITLAEKENCEGGCFQDNQSLEGGFNYFKVWDAPLLKQSSPDESASPAFEISPNPVSSSATISFSLPQDSHVAVELYDVIGRKIKTLLDENSTAGNHELQLNREQLGARVYFLSATINGSTSTSKLIIQ